MIGIYKITNMINGNCYIGQSVHIQFQWQQHKIEVRGNRANTLLYNAMRKYGIENFSFEVVEECTKEQLNEREIYWIKYYNSFNSDKGYNMTPGGSEPIKTNPQEIYDLWDSGLSFGEICEKLKNKVCRNTISNYLRDYENYSISESNRRGGNKARQTAINNGNVSQNYIVKQYDLWGNFIAEYSSTKEAGRITGIDSDTIGRAINGHQEQAGGYQWLTEGEPKDLTKTIRLKFGIIQYDLQGNELAHFKTLSEAVEKTKCERTGISKACRKIRKSANGYKWAYDYSYWNGQKIKSGE